MKSPRSKKRIAQFPNYQAIFGGPGQTGVVNQLDSIVTSCGNAHHFNQFWTTELPRLGVSPEKFNRITAGNIAASCCRRKDSTLRTRRCSTTSPAAGQASPGNITNNVRCAIRA